MRGRPRTRPYGPPEPCVRCGGPRKGRTEQFCSTTCRNRALADQRLGTKVRKTPGITCQTCGKDFWRKTGGRERKAGIVPRFCSRACFHAQRGQDYVWRGMLVISCPDCNQELYPNPNQNRCEPCARKHKRRQERAAGSRKGSAIPLAVLIDREGNRCYLCNMPCVAPCDSTHANWKWAPTVEHVIPRSKGGTDTWDNVRLAHVVCNSKKHARI